MIQLIVPLYNDQLMCELFFRNYAKYKKQHVDRLIILVSSAYSMYMKPNDPRYIQNLNYLYELLDKLEIDVHKVVTSTPIGHGDMFNAVIDDIKNPDYHCFFDEQDAYWLNDNFGEFVNMLSSIDLIGGGKSVYSNFDIKQFNSIFGVNHDEKKYLWRLHLPEFLSNRVIAQIDDFDARFRLGVNPNDIGLNDITTEQNMLFDTFQHINLQIFKKTDKIKLYFDYPDHNSPSAATNMMFNIRESLYTSEHDHNIPMSSVNIYDHSILYHMGGSGRFVGFPLSIEQPTDQLVKHYVNADSNKPTSNNTEGKISFISFCSDLTLNYFYQALPHISSLPNQSAYLSNFEKLSSYVNLKKYDCRRMIEKTLL